MNVNSSRDDGRRLVDHPIVQHYADEVASELPACECDDCDPCDYEADDD